MSVNDVAIMLCTASGEYPRSIFQTERFIDSLTRGAILFTAGEITVHLNKSPAIPLALISQQL